MNSGYTRPLPRLQVPPHALPVSNEHYTLPTHPLLTGESMRGGLQMKHIRTFLYKYLSKHVAETISWTEKESTGLGHVSTLFAGRVQELFPAFPRSVPPLG